MSGLHRFFAGIAMIVLPVLLFACATVPPRAEVQAKSGIYAATGDTVQLFHGGSKLAKEEFCLNAVVPVYHYEGRHSTIGSTAVQGKEAGKVKITKELGEYWVEGVVVEGSVLNGDIAVQPRSGCLVRVDKY